jgi:hypothetical protein
MLLLVDLEHADDNWATNATGSLEWALTGAMFILTVGVVLVVVTTAFRDAASSTPSATPGSARRPAHVARRACVIARLLHRLPVPRIF